VLDGVKLADVRSKTDMQSRQPENVPWAWAFDQATHAWAPNDLSKAIGETLGADQAAAVLAAAHMGLAHGRKKDRT
jgi:hypothetical protein